MCTLPINSEQVRWYLDLTFVLGSFRQEYNFIDVHVQ